MSVQARRLATIGALGEPLRRSLFLFVAGAGDAVSRDQAAQEFGVSRGVAAFHLDKLAELGLLDVEYRRPSGRGGPGAGRPAKFYRRVAREISFSVPPREYAVAGRLLAEAITVAGREGIDLPDALRRVAREFGRTIGTQAREQAGENPSKAQLEEAALAALGDCGYDPRPEGEAFTLLNCPFHALAEKYRDLVCGMNLELMSGFTEALERSDLEARLEPVPGQCCVRLTSSRSSRSTVGSRRT